MIMEIVCYPDPILREVCGEVLKFDDELEDFCERMVNTMHATRAAGLAAPQVNRVARIIAVDETAWKKDKDGNEIKRGEPLHFPTVMINPVIEEMEDKIRSIEGCMSLPHSKIRGAVDRWSKIKVSYRTPKGEKKEGGAEGLLACAVQHEIDHLDGILFIDHLGPVKLRMIKGILKKAEAKARKSK